MQPPSIFSSEVACNAVARRTIRERGRDYSTAHKVILDKFFPLVRQYARRGKVSREHMRSAIREMEAITRGMENIVYSRLDTVVPGPSIHERHDLRFIQAIGMRDEEMHFGCVRITVTRKYAEIYLGDSGFSVHHHVLTRYMQREYRPLQHFLRDIVGPIKVGIMLAAPVVASDYEAIALPFSSGLLFGTTHLYKKSISDPSANTTGLLRRVDVEGYVDEEVDNNLLPGHRIEIDLRTFIDDGSLNADKALLLRKLRAYEQVFANGLDSILNVALFHRPEGNRQTLHDMAVAARAITLQPEWLGVFGRRAARLDAQE